MSGSLIARSDFAGGAADRNRKEWDFRASLLTSPAGKRAGILDTCCGCLVVSYAAAAAALLHGAAAGGALKVLFKGGMRAKLHGETKERGSKGAD